MELQTFQAVYLPVSYEPNTGSVELKSLQEGFDLMGLREKDVIALPLPKATVYMSGTHQRAKKPDLENKGASLVVRNAGLKDLGVWGPALVVHRDNKYSPVPAPVVQKKARKKRS